MALKKRIIAKLLVENGVLVKYQHFTENRRVAGNPVSTARVLADQSIDEFIICDLGRIDPALTAAVSAETMTPITAAGSIHTMEHVDALIREGGCDKVVVKDWTLAQSVGEKYGKQAVVGVLDYTGECHHGLPDFYGEVLLTSIDRDGTYRGFDLDALRGPWNVPVILCGGCGKLDHAKQAFIAGADGVAMSTCLFFSDKSPIKFRSYLKSEGVPVR